MLAGVFGLPQVSPRGRFGDDRPTSPHRPCILLNDAAFLPSATRRASVSITNQQSDAV